MKMFDFKPPQEYLAPKYYNNEVDLSKVITGRFIRNSILSGKVYSDSDFAPAFFKTRDAIHPLVGTNNIFGQVNSIYGALLDSTNSAGTIASIKNVVKIGNTTYKWEPGGQGIGSWLAVKLPEPTIIESYLIASINTECPLSWILQASNDGENWIDIDTISNTDVWTVATREEKTFIIPAENRGTYWWYRIYITKTNATIMRLSTFRLFRPESVCAKGQLLLDADITNPLILSFMDGYDNSSNPVDHNVIINTNNLYSLEDMNTNIPTFCNNTYGHADIIATRNSLSDEITLSLEAQNNSSALFNNGMSSNYDGGFKVTNYNGSDAAYDSYMAFGGRWIGVFYGRDLLFSRSDGLPFYVESLQGQCYYDSANNLYTIELDNTLTSYSTTKHNVSREYVNRYVKGIRRTYNYYGLYIWSSNSPYRYKIVNGKLYQQDVTSSEWSPIQKIKIGTLDVYKGEIQNVTMNTGHSMSWMTDGDRLNKFA